MIFLILDLKIYPKVFLKKLHTFVKMAKMQI